MEDIEHCFRGLAPADEACYERLAGWKYGARKAVKESGSSCYAARTDNEHEAVLAEARASIAGSPLVHLGVQESTVNWQLVPTEAEQESICSWKEALALAEEREDCLFAQVPMAE